MSREATLILVGVLVALSPFSGLPHSWLMTLLPFLGLVAGGIGYAMRHEHVKAMRNAASSSASASSLAAESQLSPYAIETHLHPAPSRVS